MTNNFDLTAEINVQLAQNAGIKLKADIEKAMGGADYTKKVNIKASLGDATARKIFGKPANIPHNVRLKLIVSNKAGIIEEIKKIAEGKKVEIDIALSQNSLKNIDGITASLSKLKDVVGDLNKLALIGTGLKTFEGKKLAAGPDANKEKKKVKEVKDQYKDFYATVKRLASEAKAQQSSGTGLGSKFFAQAAKKLTEIKKNFKDVEVTANNFASTNGRVAQNATQALELLFGAITRVESKYDSFRKSGLKSNYVKQQMEEMIDGATKLLGTLDSAQKVPFQSLLSSLAKPFDDAIKNAQKYREELRKIGQELKDARSSGASDAITGNLLARKKFIEKQRDNNKPYAQAIESDSYQNLIGDKKNLTNVDREARAATRSINRLKQEIEEKAIFSSPAAQFLSAAAAADVLFNNLENVIKAQKKGPQATDKIKGATDTLRVKFSALAETVKSTDEVLASLDRNMAYYSENGLTQAAQKTADLRTKIEDLAKKGKGSSTKDDLFVGTTVAIDKFAENEKKIIKFIYAIDRLKASLQFSLGNTEDLSGVGKALEKLTSDVRVQADSFDERKVRQTLSEGSYKIRAKDKLNKVADQSLSAFDDAIVESGSNASTGVRGSIGEKAFSKARGELDAYIRSLDLSNDSLSVVGKNMDNIRKKAEVLFTSASVEAEGGWVGAFAKSLGLAAKRLTTFLFAARAVYGVQNAMISATGSAVELDKEFTRLEQIFAGSTSLENAAKDADTLGGKILELARNYGVASEEIAKSADIYAQAGIQGGALTKILETSTKARLGPTFNSNVEISEAVIASMNQFKIKSEEVEDVLGGISQVSAQYAVESEGITKAIRRAGGAFAAAKADGQSYLDALGEFVGAFTVLKSQTREADETLATSLRNVLNRLQRANVQKYLKDAFDIPLLDENNQFIGFAASIQLISDKIKDLGIKSGDPRFAALIQKLAGSLQSSRLTSLLSGFSDIQAIIGNFNKGGDILDRDAGIAFGSLENKLTRAKEAVIDLFTTIARSDTTKQLVETFTLLTGILTNVAKKILGIADSLNYVGKAVATIGVASLLKNTAISTAGKFVAGLGESGILGPRRPFNDGGYTGLIPGRGPNSDSLLAYLTKGEYVVQRDAVDKYGVNFLDEINKGTFTANRGGIARNKGGIIPGFNKGGLGQGVDFLSSYLKKIGVTIADDLLGSIVKTFKITNILSTQNPDVAKVGNYNKSSQALSVAGSLSGNDLNDTLLHELSHGLEIKIREALGHMEVDKALSLIPDEIRKQTTDRLDLSPDIYGKKGTSQYASNVRRELFADTSSAVLAGNGSAALDPIRKILDQVGVGNKKDAINIASGDVSKSGKGFFGFLKTKFDQLRNYADGVLGDGGLGVRTLNNPNVASGSPERSPRPSRNARRRRRTSAADSLREAEFEAQFINMSNAKEPMFDDFETQFINTANVRDSGGQYEREQEMLDVNYGTRIGSDYIQPDKNFIDMKKRTEESDNQEKLRRKQARREALEKFQDKFSLKPSAPVTGNDFGKVGLMSSEQYGPFKSSSDPNIMEARRLQALGTRVPRKNPAKINGADIPIERLTSSFDNVVNDIIDDQKKQVEKIAERRRRKAKVRSGLAILGDSSLSDLTAGLTGGDISGSNATFSGAEGFDPYAARSKPSLFSRAKSVLLSPIGSGGGSQPPNDPPKGPGSGGGGFFDKYSALAAGGSQPPGGGGGQIATLFKNIGGFSTLLSGAALAAGFYATSSKDASDKSKAMAEALSAAAAAVLAYTVATEIATKTAKSDFVTKLVGKLGGGGDKFGSLLSKGKGLFTGGVGGTLKNLGGAGLGLAKNVPQVLSKLASSAFTLAKSLGPQVLGAAVVAATEGLKSLNNSEIKKSEDIISKSTSEKEVIDERAKIDSLTKQNAGLSSFGKIAGGAAIGLTVGGPLGAAVGAAAGAIAAFATDIDDSSFMTALSGLGDSILGWVSAFGSVIGGALGAVGSSLDRAVGWIFNTNDEADAKKAKKAVYQANLDKSGANINFFNSALKGERGRNLKTGGYSAISSAISQVANLSGGFGSSTDEQKEAIKQQGQRLKEAIGGASDIQRADIISAAKKSGIDLAKVFKDIGIEFDASASEAKIAANELSRVFLVMENVSKNLSSKLDAFNANVEAYGNLASGVAGEGYNSGISGSAFDALRGGQQLSGIARAQVQQQLSSLSSLNPQAGQNAMLEILAAQSGRFMSNRLTSGAISTANLNPDNAAGGITDILKKQFGESLNGQSFETSSVLQDMFDKYIEGQGNAINESVGDNNVDYEKLNGIISGFSDSVKRGGLDLLQKFSDYNSSFEQQLNAILKRRLEFESRITDLVRSGVDRQKEALEFRKRARGEINTEATFSEAAGFDAQKQAALLRGTGLGGGATSEQLRTRYAQLSAQDPNGRNPVIQSMKDNIYKALEGIANGTDSFTAAVREFDKASEQAKRRTEELSNALLGTDENLMNTVKGIYLSQRVESATDPTQALLTLRNSDEASRAALQQRLGADPERALSFQRKLGIAPNIEASAEFRRVTEQGDVRNGASDALISINQDLANKMGALSNAMVRDKLNFEQFSLNINNYATAANNLANNLANIPQNITHQHTFTVSPIQVVITGTEGLTNLNGPMQQAVLGIVNTQIVKFANGLKDKNKGLTVDSLTLNSATA